MFLRLSRALPETAPLGLEVALSPLEKALVGVYFSLWCVFALLGVRRDIEQPQCVIGDGNRSALGSGAESQFDLARPLVSALNVKGHNRLPLPNTLDPHRAARGPWRRT